MNSSASVVGRQSIFRADDLIGYELQFRGRASRGTRATDAEMGAEVIFAVMNIGLDVLAGEKLLFCNAGHDVLTGEVPILLPPERTVVEVLESVTVDAAVERGVAGLVDAGHRIALDQFSLESGHRALLPFASIVKVDLMLTAPKDLSALVELCRDHDVELLADKVDDRGDIPVLTELGFTLFQGYALERPTLVEGKSLANADLAGLRAAVESLGVEADFDAYEQMIRRDPALAHQIMRMASYGRVGETRSTISSVRQALVVAGTEAVRRWLTLLLARPSAARGRNEAMVNVLIRARACELLADDVAASAANMAFTAGLLSALDEVLEVPADHIAEQLSLSSELHEATIGGPSQLGQLVLDVADYRYRPGFRNEFGSEGMRSGLSTERFDEAFAVAFSWAFNTLVAAA